MELLCVYSKLDTLVDFVSAGMNRIGQRSYIYSAGDSVAGQWKPCG